MASRPLARALSALAAAFGAASPASAKVYLEWRPRVTLLAGFNDNIALDGTGGDGFGHGRVGLRLDAFGAHQLRFDLDCEAGFARLLHPERFALASGALATSEQCLVRYRDRFSRRTTFRLEGHGGSAQDPFAISGLGLLLRRGQQQVVHGRLLAELDHATSPRAIWRLGLFAQAFAFGSGDPGNGVLLAPSVAYAHRATPRSTWELGVREQLFFGLGAAPGPLAPRGAPSGLLSQSATALAGYVRRLGEITTLTLRAGPLLFTERGRATWMPIGRLELEAARPRAGARLTLAHDLVIGAHLAGAVVGDLAEVGVFGELDRFAARARAGVYRNIGVRDSGLGAIGYSAEAGVDYRFAREWSLGFAALRDARLNEASLGRQVDRNVFQLRLAWERARP